MPKQFPPPTSRLQQLPLPWTPPNRAPPAQPLAPPLVPPQQVWTSLSPALKAQVRGTLLHVLQEVLDDHSCP